MTWNYRIMRHVEIIKGKRHTSYALHEVYTDGKKVSWTQNPKVGYFDSVDDLISSLEMMLRDAKKKRPVLKYK